MDPLALAAHQGRQFLVDDLDDLLSGEQTLHDLGADGAVGDLLDEIAHDLEVDVGLEQRELDLPHPGLDVVLGQFALTSEFLESSVDFLG